MRGKVFRGDLLNPLHRITPAYAGKRELEVVKSRLARDHPRVCGEKFAFFVAKTLKMGSPLHVRGKVIVDLVLTKGHGITPACAGKSFGLVIKFLRHGDHPRVCGEKTFGVLS